MSAFHLVRSVLSLQGQAYDSGVGSRRADSRHLPGELLDNFISAVPLRRPVNRKCQTAVGNTGPQPRVLDHSEHHWTSTASARSQAR